MATAQLSDRTLIRIEGPDAEHFLQNILTTDLDALAQNELKPGALLSPQGKILFDFLIARDGEDAFLLDCLNVAADDFIRRLALYKLRAKVTISKQDQALIWVSWNSESGTSQTDSGARRDTRFPAAAGVVRGYAAGVAADATEDDWLRLRIAHGIAEGGADFALGDAFPHDVLLDETDGIGFRKGCYVGQEVVSRMQHRGTARRRVMIVKAAGELPPAGGDVRANNRSIGTLGSVAGAEGLAIVRIDRVADAHEAGTAIIIGDIDVTLSIPGWARYTLPQQSGEPEEG